MGHGFLNKIGGTRNSQLGCPMTRKSDYNKGKSPTKAIFLMTTSVQNLSFTKTNSSSPLAVVKFQESRSFTPLRLERCLSPTGEINQNKSVVNVFLKGRIIERDNGLCYMI